ncbi:MAG: 30S ribosomal protein S1 [Candidatus Magasanikbacteria bacterium]|nr:30S ribosomal protein S1 [Candidatus Magasanikbacteria bacterium]
MSEETTGTGLTDTVAGSTDFKILLQNQPLKIPKVGEVVRGRVFALDRGMVHLDVLGLTTGVVRGRELFAEAHEYAGLKVGDEVEATVVELENENGEMELSFRSAGYRKAWDEARRQQASGATVKARVLGANKGGLMIQLAALPAFMPVSQLSPEHYPRVAGGDKNKILERLRELIGSEIEVKVIDANEAEEKLIVSERAVWEESQRAVLESYQVGNVVEGEITALTPFGAFVRFGNGLEGLVHISEIAWQRIDHPRDVLTIGQTVKAQIIQLDRAKIYLSIKRTVEDPWKRVKDRYSVGEKVRGKVVKIEPFGLMIALDPEIHGLAHISELSDSPISNLGSQFAVGEEREFEIVSLEPAEHRLGLKLAGIKGKSGRRPRPPAAPSEPAPALAESAAAPAATAPAPAATPSVDSADTASTPVASVI